MNKLIKISNTCQNTCHISLQDATCRSQYNCEAAYRCWDGFIAHCCFPDEYDDECIEGCFPSSVKLKLEDGRSVAMSELQVGDRVQTGLL